MYITQDEAKRLEALLGEEADANQHRDAARSNEARGLMNSIQTRRLGLCGGAGQPTVDESAGPGGKPGVDRLSNEPETVRALNGKPVDAAPAKDSPAVKPAADPMPARETVKGHGGRAK